jgi:hypothetical protein
MSVIPSYKNYPSVMKNCKSDKEFVTLKVKIDKELKEKA